MTAPTRSFSTEFGRFYAHPASGVPSVVAMFGEADEGAYAPRPSITNVIATMDEKFLPKFYAKLVAEYAVEHLDEIASTKERFGPDIAIGALKAIPNRGNDAAAIGDEVHAAIDALHRGSEVAEFSTVTAKRMFATYQNFVTKYRPEVLRSEFTVWSYKHGYAGTGDLLLRLNDQIWIVDVKTGNRVYPKVAMQCAALRYADVVLNDDGTEDAMPPADEIGVLHVRPMSTRLYRLQRSPEAFKAFLGLLDAFNWQRFDKAATLGPRPIAEVDSKSV